MSFSRTVASLLVVFAVTAVLCTFGQPVAGWRLATLGSLVVLAANVVLLWRLVRRHRRVR